MFEGLCEGLNVRLATSIKLFLEPDSAPPRSGRTETKYSTSCVSDDPLSVADTLRKYANTSGHDSSPTAVASEDVGFVGMSPRSPLRRDRTLRNTQRAGRTSTRSPTKKTGKKPKCSRSAAAAQGVPEGKHVQGGRKTSKTAAKHNDTGHTHKVGTLEGHRLKGPAAATSAVKNTTVKHQQQVTAVSTLREYTTAAAVAGKKSFIESITVNEDEHWGSPKAAGAGQRPNGLVMSPLPHRVARQMYLNDAPPLGTTNAQVPPLHPHGGVNSSPVVLGASSDPHSAYPRLPVHEGHCGPGNDGNDGAFHHFWGVPGETPDNIVFPGSKTQPSKMHHLRKNRRGDVWHDVDTSSPVEKGDVAPWNQPLQEFREVDGKQALKGDATDALSKGCVTHVETLDDYQNIFYRLWSHPSKRGHAGFLKGMKEEIAAGGREEVCPNSLVACSAILRDPQNLLVCKNLNNVAAAMGSPRLLGGSIKRWWHNFGEESVATLEKQTLYEQGNYVELSHAARILYSALLYLRTLGGFPTLQRINPLLESSSIIDKEDCLELVFVVPRAATGSRRRNTRWYSTIEERSVVIRSILAEKSCVERFGKREVVHVLPLLGEGADDSQERGSVNTLPSVAGEKLLGRRPAPETTHTISASSPTLNRSIFNISREKAIDYGDIAVAFLMSIDASKFSGVLPEPMEIEGLRYRVFTLEGCKSFRKPDVAVLKSEVDSDTERWINSRMNPFEIELLRRREETQAAQAAQAALEAQVARAVEATPRDVRVQSNTFFNRFPRYRPMTIAESTMAKADRGQPVPYCSRLDDEKAPVPRFYQLRLPRLHRDLAHAMYGVLGVSLKMASCSVSGRQACPSPCCSETK